MLEQAAIQQFLERNLHAAQARNPAYSVRSFSKRLGMNSGAVSAILRGRRRISKKSAERMLSHLDADPLTRSTILGLFPSRARAPADEARMQLNVDQFTLISKSVHFEILCLLETKGSHQHPLWMAGRLQRTVREIEDALGRLHRLGMIRRDARGKWVLTGEVYQSPDGVIPVASIRQSHFETNEQARRALELNEAHERDFVTETMAIDPAMLPVARKLVRECQSKISQLFAAGEKREVYKLSVQLFPLTQLPKGNIK